MGNWYLPRWFLHAHCSQVTNTNLMDGVVCPLTEDTKKLIKDYPDFTLYSQTCPYKHSHIFGYKRAYINFICIDCHLSCAKRQHENSPFSAVLSSPEPKAHWWAYHMARLLSVCLCVVCSHFQTPSPLEPPAYWSQISCGASMGWGNESLHMGSRSHDQDGRHAHIW